jgi:hypothetical protein
MTKQEIRVKALEIAVRMRYPDVVLQNRDKVNLYIEDYRPLVEAIEKYILEADRS